MQDVSVFEKYMTGTVITDIAAILLLISILVYTSSYRKRDTFVDRVFFHMIIWDMIAAVSDALDSILEVNAANNAGWRIALLLGHSVFTLAFEICVFLFILYLLGVAGLEEKVNKYWMVIAVPVFLLIILIIVNFFTGMLFYVDPDTGYAHGNMYFLVLMCAYIYAAAGVLLLWRIHKGLVLFTLGFVAIRIILSHVLYSVSASAFMLAVGMVFAHICMMNRSFYKGVEE